MINLQEYMNKINPDFIIDFEMDHIDYSLFFVCNYFNVTEKIIIHRNDVEDIKADNIYLEEIIISYVLKLSEQMLSNKYYQRIRKLETILDKSE